MVSNAGIATISAEQSNQQLSFRTTGGEAVRINKDGEVGIGTDDPSAKLHVSGAVNIDRGSASDLALVVNTTSTTNACRIGFNESGTRKGEIAYSHDNDLLEVIGMSGNGISLITNGYLNERLRITSDGNVNIGGEYTQTTYPFQLTGNGGGDAAAMVLKIWVVILQNYI